VRGTLRDTQGTAHAVQGSARDIEAILKSARTRGDQNKRISVAVTIGVAARLILFPLLGPHHSTGGSDQPAPATGHRTFASIEPMQARSNTAT
jgi:hypothetical protein